MAEGRTAERKVATQSEDARRADLLALVSLVQSRAKRKYKAADPRRAKYFVGQNLAISRVVLTHHYVGDILAGAYVGALSTMWLYGRVFRERLAAARVLGR